MQEYEGLVRLFKSDDSVGLLECLRIKGCDVNEWFTFVDIKMPVFLFAIHHGAKRCVKALLDAKANANTVTLFGRVSALNLAVRNDFQCITRVLLDAGADPCLADLSGVSSLHAAAHYDRFVCMEWLLLRTPRSHLSRTNREGLTPLDQACRSESWYCADLLVAAGARGAFLGLPQHVERSIAGCETCRYTSRLLYGILKFRLGTGRDMASLMARHLWITRMEEAWRGCTRARKK